MRRRAGEHSDAAVAQSVQCRGERGGAAGVVRPDPVVPIASLKPGAAVYDIVYVPRVDQTAKWPEVV